MKIEKILQLEPSLTPFGIEGPNTMYTENRFDQDYLKQIETCVKWLKGKVVNRKINRITTSYGIKHIIERELNTYVCNGAFIAATIALDIPYERIPNSPNVFVAISVKELYKNDPQELNEAGIVKL
jgi:hypothetical protein